MGRIRAIATATALTGAALTGAVAVSTPTLAAAKDCKKGQFCAWTNNTYSGKPRCAWYGNDANWANKKTPCKVNIDNRARSIYNNGTRTENGKPVQQYVRIYNGKNYKGSSKCIKRGQKLNLLDGYRDPATHEWVYKHRWDRGTLKGKPVITGGISSHKWVWSC